MPSLKTLAVVIVVSALTLIVVVLTLRWYSTLVPPPSASMAWFVAKAEQWNVLSRTLRSLQVILAVIAIVSSVLSASRLHLPWMHEGLLPVCAAISVALLTGLDLSAQANKLRNAQRALTFAILQHQQAPESKLDAVLDAYRKGEILIGDYTPTLSTAGKTTSEDSRPTNDDGR